MKSHALDGLLLSELQRVSHPAVVQDLLCRKAEGFPTSLVQIAMWIALFKLSCTNGLSCGRRTTLPNLLCSDSESQNKSKADAGPPGSFVPSSVGRTRRSQWPIHSFDRIYGSRTIHPAWASISMQLMLLRWPWTSLPSLNTHSQLPPSSCTPFMASRAWHRSRLYHTPMR